MSGHHAWLDRNIAERLTFSSFSADPNDARAALASRPFEIVALPGYASPDGLDRSSKDALWLEAAPDAPAPVWDGFDLYALFEIIYECFGFNPGSISGKIGVREKATGRMLDDPRSESALRLRPSRETNMDLNAYWRHVADLYAWACAVSRDLSDTSSRTSTLRLYSDLFTSNDRESASETVDGQKRMSFLRGRNLPARQPSRPSFIKNGPQGRPVNNGKSLGELVFSDSVRSGIMARGMTITDLSRINLVRPGDLAVGCLPIFLERDGLAPGAREDMRRARDEMMDRASELRAQYYQDPNVIEGGVEEISPPSKISGQSQGGWLSRLMRRAHRRNGSDGF